MTFQQNKTAIDGAKCLYYLWGRFYNEPVIDFDRLSPTTKHLWVERAAEAIQAVGPRRPSMVAEFNAGRRESLGQWGDSA